MVKRASREKSKICSQSVRRLMMTLKRQKLVFPLSVQQRSDVLVCQLVLTAQITAESGQFVEMERNKKLDLSILSTFH